MTAEMRHAADRPAERTTAEVRAATLAELAKDREQLLAELRAAAPGAKPGKPRWQVFRQSSRGTEYPVCKHRFGWVAERCARRQTRDEFELAVRYVARRAEA
ncbi:hypothetical protein [Actinoplanes sp. NPDC049118]|uniref:hypothetical protein n=1 Tax=Actinoplanes sp. NPDC049118 TaxID=3155769 RepID=UPI0033C82B0C